MSQTYLAVIVNLVVMFAPKLGVTVASEEVTAVAQALVTVVTGVWIVVRRYQAGGVNVAGFRTE